MAYTIREAYLSGDLSDGSSRSGSREFFVFGVESPTSNTETAVLAAVRTYASAQFDGMPIVGVSVKQVSNSVWSGSVSYAPIESDPPSGYEGFITTFSTNGGSENVFLAIDQGRLSLTDEDPTACVDHGLQVGVNADGSVEGVSIVTPKFEFTETHFLSLATVTSSYVTTLRDMTGTVNSEEFRNFEAGTVLFLGASGGIRPEQQDWSISYQFAVSPNRNFTVSELLGDPNIPFGTNFIPKKGHEYLWLTYEKIVDPAGDPGKVTTRPSGAYVSRVYREADFAGLGIGGATGSGGNGDG